MAENKTLPTGASVEQFIAAIDNSKRRSDAGDLLALYRKITGLPAVMWGPSIIGFGQVDYQYESGRSGIMPAAGFSPRKANLTLYVGDKFTGASQLDEKLGKHKKSMACLYINKLEDVDLDVLQSIIKSDFELAVES